MAKQYDIFSKQDFEDFVKIFTNYLRYREKEGLPFQKVKIITKRWKKSKTSKQHLTYWRCVSELKKAFVDVGYDVNEDDVHSFVKMRSGFTKNIDGVTIPKSIADKSEDATTENLRHLIDFMIRFAAQNLDYQINVGDM